MCPIFYSFITYVSYAANLILWNILDQSLPNAALPAATHCNNLSGVAISCQVKGNIIKFSSFFSFV